MHCPPWATGQPLAPLLPVLWSGLGPTQEPTLAKVFLATTPTNQPTPKPAPSHERPHVRPCMLCEGPSELRLYA